MRGNLWGLDSEADRYADEVAERLVLRELLDRVTSEAITLRGIPVGCCLGRSRSRAVAASLPEEVMPE